MWKLFKSWYCVYFCEGNHLCCISLASGDVRIHWSLVNAPRQTCLAAAWFLSAWCLLSSESLFGFSRAINKWWTFLLSANWQHLSWQGGENWSEHCYTASNWIFHVVEMDSKFDWWDISAVWTRELDTSSNNQTLSQIQTLSRIR